MPGEKTVEHERRKELLLRFQVRVLGTCARAAQDKTGRAPKQREPAPPEYNYGP